MESIVCHPQPRCELCGSAGKVMQSGVKDPDGNLDGSWSFQKCSNKSCEVYWIDPTPPASELWKAYATYHTHTQEKSRKFGKIMLSLLHRFIKLGFLPAYIWRGLQQDAIYLKLMTLGGTPKGKLLDVGCGGGRFLLRMRKRGWDVEGTDFDKQAVNKVKQRYGMTAHVGDLPDCQLPDNTFDAITMNQTVEHLYNPKATLVEGFRILKPSGVLVMVTPNVDSLGAQMYGSCWRGWEAPRHLHLFSTASLKRLCEQVGFEIEEARTSSAGSAVVYRVSDAIAHGEGAPWLTQATRLFHSYQQELAENIAQLDRPLTGQNVVIRARKPL